MTIYERVGRRFRGAMGGPLLAAMGIVLLAAGTSARADDFCCPCKNKPQSIEAGDMATATAQCSITCKRFVLAKSGRCEGDAAAAAPAPAPATAPATGAAAVSLFKTDDCSGEATTVSASTPSLPEAYLSFRGEAGVSMQVWEKPAFAGASTQPVGAGICVSPGWPIAGVKLAQ